MLPQIYAGWHPTNASVAVAIGLSTPFGLGLDYGRDSLLRQTIIRDSFEFSSLTAALAWSPVPDLTVSAGPTWNHAAMELEQGLAPVNLGDRVNFSGSGDSFGGTLGILWQAGAFQFGAVYRGSAPIDHSGTFQVKAGSLPMPSFKESARLQMKIPQQVSFGCGWQATTNLQVEVDALWTEWSCWDQATLKKTSGNMTTQ